MRRTLTVLTLCALLVALATWQPSWSPTTQHSQSSQTSLPSQTVAARERGHRDYFVPAAPPPTTTVPTTLPPTTTTLPMTPTTEVPSATGAAASGGTSPIAPPASDDLYDEWTRVAVCEEGGWIGSSGPAYPDSLGISAANWYANGGTSDTSPDAQIAVAERIQADPPDQVSCASW